MANRVVTREGDTTTVRPDCLVDCGDRAVWTVSSAKHGFGVQNLLDWKNSTTFWQSDGLVPHSVTLHFHELTPIASVEVLTNIEDESYAPKLVELRGSVRDGAHTVITTRELTRGWCKLPTFSADGWGELDTWEAEADEEAAGEDVRDNLFWCTSLQLLVLENHSRGRDCRVRALRVLTVKDV